ncbi:MAG: hypothetical protein DHS20C16_35790 [Phycisphaerae bacterium]|nr:MAG: hypothetical protein DHS20C16_35790 [Phycisphaerae bacterium]
MFGMMKRVKIRSFEKGFLFRDREFRGIVEPGRRWFFGMPFSLRIDISSQRDPWIEHEALDVIARSGMLGDAAEVLEIRDHERALVWIDGRFDRVLLPGLYAIWKNFHQVRVEHVDARRVRFEHTDLNVIRKSPSVSAALDQFSVDERHVGVYLKDGVVEEMLEPGQYAFWKDEAKVKLLHLDLREKMVDVAGQEIMTFDKVTLRINAVVTYAIEDVKKTIERQEDPHQALYREAQLALRTAVGTKALDDLLSDKAALSTDLETALRARAAEYGLGVSSVGVRDIILPGEMKDLLNRVTEAKKAAEANLITRREETAAMRSQVNTAKLLESNPTLMRLRELETLATIAESTKLQVILGEKGLADRVVNLL